MSELQTPTQNVDSAQPVGQDLDDEISLLDLLQVVVDNLRLLVLGPLAVGLLALGVTFLITPTFTAKVQFMPPQQQQSAAAGLIQSLGALGGLAGAASGIKNPSDQYLAFLKSRSLQDALIDRFKLMERDGVKLQFRQDVRAALEGKVRASSGKDGLIAVEVDDKDPQFAADLANAHVEELHKLLGRLAVTEAQQRRAFFEKQLEQTKANLVKAEQALRASGVSSGTLKSNPAAAVAGLASLKAALTAQEIKLANMRSYLTDNAPAFKQAQNELLVIKQQIVNAEAQDSSGSPTSLSSSSAPIGAEGQGDYITRYRDYKYHETLLELFAKQYEVARIDESREGAVIQVVDAAQPPERKSKPKKALIAIISTLAAGFVLLLWVFVKNALSNAQNDTQTSQKLFKLKQSLRGALGRG